MAVSLIIKSNSKISVKNKNFTTLQDTFTTLQDTMCKSCWKFTRLFKYGNHKFKIVCEFSNGDPMGFKNNKALYVFDMNSCTWKALADCCDAGIKYDNDYYKTDDYKTEYCTELVKAFYNYVELIFGE